MNRQEYLESGSYSTYHYKVQKLLKEWKEENNIAEICHVHHRDDTEECRKYNAEHYERWGFNEDGTFELGKYVLFLTRAEHTSYHSRKRIGKDRYMYGRTGELHHFYGKHHTAESRAKISKNRKGISPSAESRAKMSEARKGENNSFYGKVHSAESKTKMSTTHKIRLAGIKILYSVYKNNNGIKNWYEFQKAVHNGDITFEERPISVFL